MSSPAKYGDEVARILALDPTEARTVIAGSNLPPPVRAGLFLHFGCWNEAHEVAQGIDTREGSYWHAIVHRQEPDASNAAYWFRRVGAHPVFPLLRDRAAAIGIEFGPRWDPLAFIDYCERARPGSEEERKANQVQRAEWELLFDWCVNSAP